MHKHLPERWDGENEWYFVTVVTQHRQPFFESERACQIFLRACRTVCEKHTYRLGSLVIMPDHWHAIIRPKGKEVIETIVGSIKQRIFHESRNCGERIIRWQSRFMDRRIRDEKGYYECLEYMRLNPAKHDYVKDDNTPWQWWFVHSNPFE